MQDSITVETELFEHRKPKPHFINPCCFGEDFAAWMKEQISSLAQSGFTFSELIQEDYGWGFWARRGEDPFLIAFGVVGDAPHEGPAQWIVIVTYDPGLNVVKRLFHKPDAQAFATLRDRIRNAIQTNKSMKIIGDSVSEGEAIS